MNEECVSLHAVRPTTNHSTKTSTQYSQHQNWIAWITNWLHEFYLWHLLPQPIDYFKKIAKHQYYYEPRSHAKSGWKYSNKCTNSGNSQNKCNRVVGTIIIWIRMYWFSRGKRLHYRPSCWEQATETKYFTFWGVFLFSRWNLGCCA